MKYQLKQDAIEPTQARWLDKVANEEWFVLTYPIWLEIRYRDKFLR